VSPPLLPAPFHLAPILSLRKEVTAPFSVKPGPAGPSSTNDSENPGGNSPLPWK
jgi:hypothetical protein